MSAFIKRNQIIILSIFLCLFSLNMALSGKKRIGADAFVGKGLSVVATPFQMGALSAYSAVSNTWNGYISLVGLAKENELQDKEILALTEENNRLKEVEIENLRLKAILAFKKEAPYSATAARILAFNLGGWTRTIKLNKGANDAVNLEMPVLSPAGVVGMIIKAREHTSDALLITDPRSNVDIIIRRTRVRGVAEGNGAKGLSLKYIRELDDVVEGDEVITAGQSGIYPKGLKVGVVSSVERAGDNFFKRVEITPAADLKTLEEVIIASKTD